MKTFLSFLLFMPFLLVAEVIRLDGVDFHYRIPQKYDTTFRKTGTNNVGFSDSRNGDYGNRLAPGIILPPFCVYARRVAAVIFSY